MSGNDKRIIQTNERVASPDINELQDLGARQVSELAGRNAEGIDGTGGEGCPGVSLRPSSVGGNLFISGGALIQTRPGGVGAAGADDSATLVGIFAGGNPIVLPSPPADTWYLIEARVTETSDPLVPVDIFDTGSQTFVSTPSLKRTRFTCEFQLQAGTTTNLPASVTADWEPIGGLFVPAGGAPLTNDNVFDLRVIVPTPHSSLNQGRYRSNFWTMNELNGAIAAATLSVRSVVESTNGLASFKPATALDTDFFDPEDALILDPTAGAAAAEEWRYLYLTAWTISGKDINPRFYYRSKLGTASDIDHEGLLLVSDVSPRDDGSRLNSGTITCPAPFNAVTIPANNAVCIGAIRRNNAGTAWEPFNCVDNYVTTDQNPSIGMRMGNGALPLALDLPDVPDCATKIDMSFQTFSAALNSTTLVFTKAAGASGIDARKDAPVPAGFVDDFRFMRHYPTLDRAAITVTEIGGPLGVNLTVNLAGFYM